MRQYTTLQDFALVLKASISVFSLFLNSHNILTHTYLKDISLKILFRYRCSVGCIINVRVVLIK